MMFYVTWGLVMGLGQARWEYHANLEGTVLLVASQVIVLGGLGWWMYARAQKRLAGRDQ